MSNHNTKRPHSPSPHNSSPPAKRRAHSPEEGEVESTSPPQRERERERDRRPIDSYRPRYSRSPSRSPVTRRHRLPPRPSSPPREWDRWPPAGHGHGPNRMPGRTRNPYLDADRHVETLRPLDTPGAPVAEERVGIEQPGEKEEGEEEDRGRDRRRSGPPIDPKLDSAVEDTIARIEREANEAEAKRKDDGKERAKVLRLSPDQEMQAYGRKFVGTSQLRDYAIMEKLGEGTFGEVHKATHTVTRKIVALKRILMHNEKEGLPVTALREIKILKMLNHASVVPVCDMVVEASTRDKKGSIYMVFPYMDHDLAGLLENPAVKFSPSQIKLYMRQLLEGTEYLHRNKILHRDLKAANLLINNSGSLQIADFGLARPYSSSNPGWDPRVSEVPWDASKGGPERGGGGARYTNCVVTRWYRPPELLMGEAHYGCAIDMWGVGCIMGEMWTRRPILCGSSDADQLDKIWDLCGTPDESTWPGWRDLPSVPPIERKLPNRVKAFFREGTSMDEAGIELVDRLLALNPAKRITAFEALDHDWFWVEPLCCDPAR
ncbi:kinase-like domain-containing protein [Rhizoctonia solani]|nr:kinase-like domain-containing protein [Rhizoctonia solani]